MPTGIQETDGSLHCSEDQVISGQGPNGAREEVSSSEVKREERNDDSSQD